jgi:phosphatidylserine decarboxylase
MAREGFYFFSPFLILAIFFFYLFDKYQDINLVYAAVIAFAVGCLFILFFRDPERKIPEGDNLIVSPADGKIVGISETNKQLKISIFLSIFDVHINRIPVNGVVQRLTYKPGKFFSAFKQKASDLNERFEIEIKTDNHAIIMHQIAGVLARRVVCRLKKDQPVQKGKRFGLIRFGSRVDLFLPSSVRLEVRKGQRVTGGKTIIGRLS